MKNSRVIQLVVVAVVVFSLSTSAAEPSPPPAAPAAASETSAAKGPYLHVDVGPSLMNDVQFQGGGSAEMNTGARGDIALGYNFCEWSAAEFEIGAIWNEFKGGGGDLYQIPILANGIIKLPNSSALTPYAGVGIGGVATMFDVADFGSDTDFTFGYQAMAGIRLALAEKAQVDLAYKFFGSLDHSWTISGLTVESDGLYSHSLVASLTWKF